MPRSSVWRLFTVTLAATVAARSDGQWWSAGLALAALAVGLWFETRGAGDRTTWVAAERTACARAAEWWPWLVASLAVVAWLSSLFLPDVMGLREAAAVLVLAHATSFAAVATGFWPAVARRVSQEWARAVSAEEMRRLAECRTVVAQTEVIALAGSLRVTQVEAFESESAPEEVLRSAAGLLRTHDSPLATALGEAARRAQLALPKVDSAELMPGLGWRAEVDGQILHLGGLPMAAYLGQDLSQLRDEVTERQKAGGEVWFLLGPSGPRGLLMVADEPRAEPSRFAHELRAGGVAKVVGLSHAQPDAAASWGERCAFDAVLAGPPEHELPRLREGGVRVAVVADPAWHPTALVLADAAVATGQLGMPPAGALLATGLEPEQLTMPWRAAQAVTAEDARWCVRLVGAGLLLAFAALVGLPVGLVVMLDELVTITAQRATSR